MTDQQMMQNRPELVAVKACWKCDALIGDAEYLVDEDGCVCHHNCREAEPMTRDEARRAQLEDEGGDAYANRGL